MSESYKDNDHSTCEEVLNYSQMVMELYEALRKDGGVTFTADQA